jgi:hypothetical protein
MKTTVLENIQAGFKGSNKIPDALVKFIEWSQGNPENQDFISGPFEFCEAGDWIMERFLEEPEFQERFGVFGQSGDAYIYCAWLQDNGRQPVVHLGSGQGTMLIAADFTDYLRLLAIGYNEDLSTEVCSPPINNKGVNLKFQQWVIKTFKVTIPRTGEEIIQRAIDESDDLNVWLNRNCHGW